jgi:hypothetical protein
VQCWPAASAAGGVAEAAELLERLLEPHVRRGRGGPGRRQHAGAVGRCRRAPDIGEAPGGKPIFRMNDGVRDEPGRRGVGRGRRQEPGAARRSRYTSSK